MPRRTLRYLSLIPILGIAQSVAAAPPPEGIFTQPQCLECHAQASPRIIDDWRAGPHAQTECIACHGDRHGQLPTARQDAACTGCHGGEVAHSYVNSKHGAIAAMERRRTDYAAPLQRGRYRVPGCSYCHNHDSDHGDSMNAARGPSIREWVCSGCHAPRFIADQFAAGQGLVEIGLLKEREAAEIAARHPDGPQAVAGLMENFQRHLANLRLGFGHQSPDYQWWHGQPALDGDLIRLRNAVEEARRERALSGGIP